jgi:NAD(P)-dependent dehydrogenase (short-subunit alcohol dehydrogenase family)
MTIHRVAIITGASRGVGAGLVAAYRGRDWAVVASARTVKPSEEPDLLTVAGDIAEPATAGRIVDAALERFGRIDTLVNNAGVFIAKPFTDYTADDYATVVGGGLTGFFWLTQRAIAEMATRYGGHVVSVSASPAEAAQAGPPAVLTALAKGGLGDQVAGHRVRRTGHPRQCRLPGHHPGPAAPGRRSRRPRQPASPAGILALHHRRGPARRRRLDGRSA